MKGPLVLVAGGYGHGNVGDDAIGVAICRLLREVAPDVRIIVLGGSPSRLRQTMREEGRYLSWRSPLRATQLLGLVRRSDAVLVGGGGLLQDHPHFYRPYLLLAMVAEALGKPVMFYAVGAYPPTTAAYRLMARMALGRARAVTVRDDFSARSIAAAGLERRVVVTADPAITLKAPERTPSAAREAGPPVIGISLRPMHHDPSPDMDAGTLAGRLAACLDAVVDATNARLLFVPMHFGKPDDDGLFDNRVVHRMKRPVVVEMVAQQRPDDVLTIVRSCDVVLGMRLHANVLAAAAGTPSIALAYDPKVREFMRQLGYEDRVLDIHALEPSQVAARVAALLAERETASAELRRRVEPLRASARDCALMAARLAGCAQAVPEGDRVAVGAGS